MSWHYFCILLLYPDTCILHTLHPDIIISYSCNLNLKSDIVPNGWYFEYSDILKYCLIVSNKLWTNDMGQSMVFHALIKKNWMTDFIRWARHVTDWTTLPLVGGTIPYLGHYIQNIEYLRVSEEETFGFFETWMPERDSKPLSPTSQAGSFNHCTRAPALHKIKSNTDFYKIISVNETGKARLTYIPKKNQSWKF